MHGPTIAGWEVLLARYAPASPELVQRRELGNRADSKFVIPAAAAADLLGNLTGEYTVVAVGAVLVATYRTLYFDSEDLGFFHAHRRGRRVRHKVRIRHYPERGRSFLDVKTRINDVRTIKTRLERPYGDDTLSPVDLAFVHAHTGPNGCLLPQVWTDFRRVTLVGVHTNERVTFDLELCFKMGERVRSVPDVAIVEVKQAPFDRRTPAMMALRSAGWWPQSLSKYCTAIACLRPGVRLGGLGCGVRTLEEACS